MLWFERQVVTTLVSGLDSGRQQAVKDYVDGSLQAMPEHLRAGVAVQSILLGTWARLRWLTAGPRHQTSGARLEPLENSRVGLVRQYVRLLRSLTLFAEHELA